MAGDGFRHQPPNARSGQAVRAGQQRSVALQEYVDPRPCAVDVRPQPPALDRLAQGQVQQKPGARRSQRRRAQRRARLRRNGGVGRAAQAVRRRCNRGRARFLPHRHWRGVAGPRAGRRGQIGQPADVLWFVPDHPGIPDPPRACPAQGVRRHHFSGRGRDRGDLLGNWRQLCRSAWRDFVQRPRHRAQGRGDGPRDHHRTAACDRQLTARRAIDRAADQDGTERLVPSRLRPQRRRAAGCAGDALTERLLRGGHRGVPHRGPVHDAGHGPDRRLYRQRRRAVARPRHGGVCALPGQVPHRCPDVRAHQPLRPRPRNPEPHLDQAWHPRPDPSHRRHRKGREDWQHQLRSRQPPGNDRHPADQGGERRAGNPLPDGRSGSRARASGGRRLGLDLRPDPQGGPARAGEGGRRRPYPHPPYLAAADEPRRLAARVR